MNGFFLYPLIALLMSINTIFNRVFYLYGHKYYYPIQDLLIFLELIFWIVFFLRIFKTPQDSKKVKIISATVVVIGTISLFFSNFYTPHFQIHSLFNIYKAIFCLVFYINLFKNTPRLNILQEPSFWIITGLFFYTCLSLPFFALNEYIKIYFSQPVAYDIFVFSNIFIIIMHLFFIKAYLCTTRLHKA